MEPPDAMVDGDNGLHLPSEGYEAVSTHKNSPFIGEDVGHDRVSRTFSRSRVSSWTIIQHICEYLKMWGT